jgi:hypothetical protein
MVTFVLGGLFLADSAGLLQADSALAFWPVGLLALGFVVVLQPDAANRMVGAMLLVAGVWLLLNNVGVWNYSFWHTWPYLLIVFGAWILYRARQLRARDGLDGAATGFAFLNRVVTQVTTVRAGDLNAVGGECRVDLSAAHLDGNTDVVIDVFALFGRITLQVPAGWRVENRVLPLLGRVEDLPPSAAAGPLVVVQGSAIGSSISIAAAS